MNKWHAFRNAAPPRTAGPPPLQITEYMSKHISTKCISLWYVFEDVLQIISQTLSMPRRLPVAEVCRAATSFCVFHFYWLHACTNTQPHTEKHIQIDGVGRQSGWKKVPYGFAVRTIRLLPHQSEHTSIFSHSCPCPFVLWKICVCLCGTFSAGFRRYRGERKCARIGSPNNSHTTYSCMCWRARNVSMAHLNAASFRAADATFQFVFVLRSFDTFGSGQRKSRRSVG